jgi:hypothetical protein
MLSLEAPYYDLTGTSTTKISEGCSNMQTINLGGCPITDISLKKLSEGSPNILSLDFSGCCDLDCLKARYFSETNNMLSYKEDITKSKASIGNFIEGFMEIVIEARSIMTHVDTYGVSTVRITLWKYY